MQVRILRKRRVRGEKSLFPDLETLRLVRSGNKVSRFFRHILERINVRSLLGGNLAAAAIITGTFVPASTALSSAEPEVTTLEVKEIPLTTKVAIRYPTEKVVLNQGYHFFHWGIDLDGVTGDPIYPVKKGRVERVESSRWGYGNSVLVDHGDGTQSLYAHLSAFEVKEGDEVAPNQVIGKMGSTGRSTGDHLHLEIYKNGRPVNPRSVLGY